ncbi:MAG: polyphosphate kinase 1 [Calditrichaeota bacterium]|nr:MAG: polyphosphate kinase 1 [Calditrichota bacterium]
MEDIQNVENQSIAQQVQTSTKPYFVKIGQDKLPNGLKFDDLEQHQLYLNRELTWLNFNRRVLHEAEKKQTPLLERVKFLAIVASNTDEFFMKRIGGLKQLVQANVQTLSIDGRTPKQQLIECYNAINEIEEVSAKLFRSIKSELKSNGIHLLEYSEIPDDEKELLREYFINNIFPLITPQSVGPAHPFPFISNLSLNLLVYFRESNKVEQSTARVKVPVGKDVPRFVKIGDEESFRFVKFEDLIKNNLDLLFPGVTIISCEIFRVTRNANTEKDEERADDLLEMIESELVDRKFAPIVRIQFFEDHTTKHQKAFLSEELDLDLEKDVYDSQGMLGKRDLMQIAFLDRVELQTTSFKPIDHPRLKESANIFNSLREEGPILLFHPYDSFKGSIERILKEASSDPNVRAIKMTLYRTSDDTKVIKYLVKAAQNKKQVTVVVELKARFDEEANIFWASKLEEQGIHITYGVVGFKTHSKVILIVRKEQEGFKLYSHIGTGNYHAGTAKLYTDLGILNCDSHIGRDLTEYFNFLTTGCSPQRKFSKILMAPSTMKKQLIAKIEREIEVHKVHSNGRLIFKANALEDPDITLWLYKASQNGVKISLIIRDTCRLRPRVKKLSENIEVFSIIGRFLEHFRAFYFYNNGSEEYFIGSADLMKRNLEKRIEVLTPVEDEYLKRDLKRILEIQLDPKNLHWDMQGDGSYKKVGNYNSITSQEILLEIAERRQKESEKLKRINSKGKAKKEYWSGN